jgi:hypothetical protein
MSRCKDGMHLPDSPMICIVGVYFSGTLEGGWMGDNLMVFGEVLGVFWVFGLIYYYIIHIHT